MAYSICGSEPSSYVIVVDYAGRLVVEAFHGFDQDGIDVIQPHGCPQGGMPNSCKRLLEVHEEVVKILLVLHVLPTECSKVENLLYFDPSPFHTLLNKHVPQEERGACMRACVCVRVCVYVDAVVCFSFCVSGSFFLSFFFSVLFCSIVRSI